MTKRVMVVGGGGYVGAVLVPQLLEAGYQVGVYDLFIFGREVLPSHPNLTVTQGDVRDLDRFKEAIFGYESVIHLACISNDPSFELNPDLSRSINFDAFEPTVLACKQSGVSRFIYASSSSVYGVSDAPEVTEEHPLVPLTDYNKFKGLTEPVLLKYQDDNFTTVVIRPATICGYSPRMRLDLSVNILTNHAINKRKITVFGGPQRRPNIHINDICDLYTSLLEMPSSMIAGEIFNAGYENHSISNLATIVKTIVEAEYPELTPIEIECTDSDDLRSYHVSSKKIAERLGFVPKRTIEDAVRDLCKAFQKKALPDSFENPNYFNVKRIQEIGLR